MNTVMTASPPPAWSESPALPLPLMAGLWDGQTPQGALLGTLYLWAEQGWLRRLDSALAAFALECDPQAPPALLMACALLSQMEGRGHSALPLAALAASPQALLGWPEAAQPALQQAWADLPRTVAGWVQALQSSPVVRRVLPPLPQGEGRGEGLPPPASTGAWLVLDGPANAPLLYLRRYWDYETQVAQALRARAAQPPGEVGADGLRTWLGRLFPDAPTPSADGKPPCDWQQVACALALRGGVSVITGGPGTGKTYTAARLLALLLATHSKPAQLRIGLAAPTGKAAARLRQSIDQSLQSLQASVGDVLDLKALTDRIGPATTLHKLLGARPDTRQFHHDARHPLELDVLLVDETSMVHLEMMAALLQALPQQARLVLLGDKDQLASVEAGAVLGDLCAGAAEARYDAETLAYLQAATGQPLGAAQAPQGVMDSRTVMLRESRRFGTAIGALALAVNAGDGAQARMLLDAAMGADPRSTPPALIWSAPAAEATPALVPQLALQGRPGAPASYADYLRLVKAGPGQESPADRAHADWARAVLQAFERFRILCAVHEGPWGDRALNPAVQAALAHAGWLDPRGEWFVGRPVMVTRNDPALGVFNGDVGVVLPAFQPDGQARRSLRAYFLDGEALRSVAVSRLAHVETAFAMTIHKSQGSEFAHTVVVLPDGAGEMLTRELVYTGITRARTHFSLVEARPGLLETAVQKQVQRASGLQARLGC
ncbi:MAG: exodeoxyribonuclease V subunit alpha [Burkholderiaceae bacterium]|nr:exodeoxyribonuclease V subunit alpha [Burkholderiaceae bacterium]